MVAAVLSLSPSLILPLRLWNFPLSSFDCFHYKYWLILLADESIHSLDHQRLLTNRA